MGLFTNYSTEVTLADALKSYSKESKRANDIKLLELELLARGNQVLHSQERVDLIEKINELRDEYI